MSDINIHALPIGHTFDGYRILRLLGAGGFGITYLAEEVVIGRKVAIKEYLPQGFAARASDSFTVRAVSTGAQQQFAWGLDRFRKEAATLVAFEHPNIVSVYRYFEANGTAYLVMQYVEGKPLDALLAKGKTLAESEVEEVILPILDGLEEVHAAHFLHRDIKPANIYIRRDGRPVLLDFGAARQAFGGETKSITAIVSEGYAPFEQYEVKGDQGPWTDVYALGAVLYRCITGERPPAAPERVSARLRGAPDPMPPAREAAQGHYSTRLLEATNHALATMQAERPQSIGALRALLKGGDASRVESRAPSLIGAASGRVVAAGAAKPKGRMPLMAAVGGLLAAGGVAAYFLLAPKPPAPGTVATPATPPTTISSATPATPGAPATPVAPEAPAQPSPEAIAERAANEAEAKAETDLAALKAAVGRGELARARSDIAGVIGRIEEALRKRPSHAGLQRVSAAARQVETDLTARIAARVKELTDAAEREGVRNYDEAQRLLAEAERLDRTAASNARQRVERDRRRAEDDKKQAAAEEKRRLEEEKKRAEEEEKRRQEEARRERESRVELHVSLARYHFDQARGALAQSRYAEARRVAEQARIQLDRAKEVQSTDPKAGPEPPLVAALRREVQEFERDLTKRIADRVAVLVREARDLIQAGKLDDVAKRLDEAAELEPGSPELAAARKEYEEARRKPQAPPDPDAAERERTKNIVPDSTYDARTRRGSAYFAFGSTDLTPTALAVLAQSAAAAREDANSYVVLSCSYDQLEVKDAGEGRALAQARCDKAQRIVAEAGLARARIRAAIAPATAKGPNFRRAFFMVHPEKASETAPEAAKPPETQARPGAFQLAGRTARLSRLLAERRAVMRIELQFGAGGALGVSCSAESADGGQTACFGQRNGSGRWTLNGAMLCVSSPVINLPGNTCYEISGAGNQLRLAGAGILAGVMLLQ